LLSVTKAERESITGQLPAINRIRNIKLRDMVIAVWVKLLHESPCSDVAEAPNALTEIGGDESLVRHTNAIVSMAEAMAREFQQAYGVTVNYDNLRAGAILHDVDKLVLYERKGDSVLLSELGCRETHGEYGSIVAEQAGLPQEVVNIIASHSPIKRKTLPATIEAVFIASCDAANFHACRLLSGEGLWEKH